MSNERFGEVLAATGKNNKSGCRANGYWVTLENAFKPA